MTTEEAEAVASDLKLIRGGDCVPWIPIAEQPPPNHHTVLLWREGSLCPVVGSLWGNDEHGEDPSRLLYQLEEGGPEDGEHRSYPWIAREAEPTHWRPLPALPGELIESPEGTPYA